MATEHGPRHRWDTARSRCLDCGRDAEEIASELEEQLAQAQDQIERLKTEVSAAAAISDALTLDSATDTYSVPRKKLIDATHHWLANHQSEQEQLAQARALLERCAEALEGEGAYGTWPDEIRAFLASLDKE